MKKILSIVLIMIMALPVIGSASARSTIHKTIPTEAQKATTTPITEDFYLGSDYHEIAYGDSKVEYNGKEYKFVNDELVCGSGDKTECLSAVDGDNLNISNNKLYYFVYEDGNASVVVYDLTANTENVLFHIDADRIVNMYVINDSRIELLAGGRVYCYDFNTKSIETVETPKDVFNFIPTAYGNIYGTGSSVDAAIVFMGKVLVRHATYYSVEDGVFIATIDGTTYQMSLTEIVNRCKKNDDQNNHSVICPIQDMDEYEFFGSYNLTDVINLNSDDCEECDNAENAPAEERKKDDLRTIPYGIPITPNSRQQTMINRATEAVELIWTPKVSFSKWHSNLGTYSNDYIQNVPYTGLPYSRPGHFGNTNFYHVYIGIGSFSDGTPSSLSGFVTRVANTNDPFNQAASTTTPNIKNGGYGALYGLDCSRFVCYSWGYSFSQDHGSAGYDSDPQCYKITSKSNGSTLSMSDLAKLVPGDALVKADHHAILVTAVYKDNNGTVTRVEIMEEVSPKAHKLIFGSDDDCDYSLYYLRNTKLKPDSNDGTPYQIYRLKEYLHLSANSGSVTPNTIHIITGKTYGFFNNGVLPTPVRANYLFLGWYTQSSGGTLVTASTMVENNSARTLYAHWTLARGSKGVDQYYESGR